MSAFSMAHAEPAYYLPTAEHRRYERHEWDALASLGDYCTCGLPYDECPDTPLARERRAAAADDDMTGTCQR